MSYILDALNKADKERKQQATNSPHTAPTIVEPSPSSHRKLWIGLLIIVVIGLWFLLNSEENKRPANIDDQHTALISPASSKIPTPPPVQIIKPAAIKPTSTTVSTTSTIQAQTKPKESQETPHIMGLDSNIRQQLPAIDISAHVYSNNVSKRMVIINQSVLHEGDYVAESLILKHIKPDGITLEYKGSPFTMRVKDTWTLQ